MEHTNSLLVQDMPLDKEETCDCCGAHGHPHAPLKWKIDDKKGSRADVYCDSCYWEFRRDELAEEAVIQAIKLAKLDKVFTLSELQRAMDGVCGLEPQWFAEYLKAGTTSRMEARSARELLAAYGPSVAEDVSKADKGHAA